MRWMIFAVVLALASLGVAARADQDQRLKGYTLTGTKERCLPIQGIWNTQIIDASRILFFMNGGSVYLSQLPERCVALNRYRGFRYSTSLDELCSTDIITVFDPGPPVLELGSCGLGEFELLKKAPAH